VKRYRAAQQRKKIILPDDTVLLEPSKITSGYSESETMALLAQVIARYPKLFDFSLLDYNTREGIDFIVEKQSSPKYVELKGTMGKYINHPFRHIHKFICYEVGLADKEKASDIEVFIAELKINPADKFVSGDANFHGKVFRSYNLIPESATLTSMEIVELKSILLDVVGAKFA